MNNKAQALATWLLVILIAVAVIGGGVYLFTSGDKSASGTSQQIIQQTAKDIAKETKSGDVASVGVYVRNLANDNVNTKIAVPIYCQDNTGGWVIDGTTSSTTAETTGKSTIGKTITCYAFNSTVQTMTPSVTVIDEEAEHIVIDAYVLTTGALMTFYDDSYTVADLGVSNVTLDSEGSESLQKLRIKNNASDEFLPLGGIYFSTVASANVTDVDITGSASLEGMDHSSAQIVQSSLSTSVSTRKDNWDYVFEIDDDSGKAGNQVLLMDENDYLDTGAVVVSSTNSNGCDGAEAVTPYLFTKGYFRESTGEGVGYGHESDAVSSAVISTDITDSSLFYCD